MDENKVAGGPTRDELIAWLEELERIVYEVKFKQFVFKSTWDVITSNPELQKRPSHFYDWLTNLYFESLVMAIRRLCDDDSQTLSLVTFLRSVKKNPSVVSRAAYAELFPPDTIKHPGMPRQVKAALREHLINEGYDETVGKGLDQPTGKDIRRETAELKRLAERILTFANKRLAHYDREAPKEVPTLDDIDAFLEHATKLVQKYLLLLKAVSTDLRVHFQYDWLSPFRVAWLPDELWLQRLRE